ncbi:hypothetical protein GCM10027053_27790 [Intrasporangium mesophilum]
MSGPSVVVERAPDGWTHIGGPGMHLLIGLDEEDDRTLTASDAADGGDLDEVIEVLTSGGMRNAHHFVGVHWEPATRVVAFGPVSAVVTLADGSVHEVRAMSGKVWTDLELPEHPERVVLRVLDENEANDPVPPQTLAAALGGVSPAPDLSPYAAQPAPDADASPVVVQADSAPAVTAGQGGLPTFGSPAPSEARAGSSAWGRSWARPSETLDPTPLTPDDGRAAAGSRLRSWASAAPAVPVRAARPQPGPADPSRREDDPAPGRSGAAETEPPVPAAEIPSMPSGRVDGPSDLESTWAARPAVEPEPEPAPVPLTDRTPDERSPGPAPSLSSTYDLHGVDRLADVDAGDLDAGHVDAGDLDAGDLDADSDTDCDATDPEAADSEDSAPAAPSYDYLFGHTVAVDEHRRVLAELSREKGPQDDETGDASDINDINDISDTAAAAPGDSGRPTVPGGAEAASPSVPGIPVAPIGPAPEEANPSLASGPSPGPDSQTPRQPSPAVSGLISSVPWATSASPAPAGDAPGVTAHMAAPAGPASGPPTFAEPPTSVPVPPEPDVDVPSFAGRHTPPPTPSLVPPSMTPPPTVTPPAQVSQVPPHPHQPEPEAPDAGVDGVAVSVDRGNTDGDDTELTVDRSALLAARQAVMGEPFSGPAVLAVLCSAGHPTPPHGERCRVCGGGIPPQEAFTMPRPPLGVLRLSTGDVVTLDRSVLLGRAPTLGEGLAATDRPHVVKVPSPERDVSRNHVEVILEGWHVLIRDLATTNGTMVTLPGDSPVRLRANDQQVLEPGSVVSMADEVHFTFEAAP